MLYKTYCQLLKPRGLGLGLYSPPRVDKIRLGSLGYFDDNGIWHEIVRDVREPSSPLPPCNLVSETDLERSGGSIIASQNLQVKAKSGVQTPRLFTLTCYLD